MYCERPDDPNVGPLAVEYPLADTQVPDHDAPVHDSVPVKPELHVHDGAPAALAGHPTSEQVPDHAPTQDRDPV